MNIARAVSITTILVLTLSTTAIASAEGEPDAAGESIDPHAFVRVSRLIGREVSDRAGEPIGEIEEYVVFRSGGIFAVVATGGFLGISQREVLIPHDALTISPLAPELLVYPGTAESLSRVTAFDPSEDLLKAAARERRLIQRAREQENDVSEARQALQSARARLAKELDDLEDVTAARNEVPRESSQ